MMNHMLPGKNKLSEHGGSIDGQQSRTEATGDTIFSQRLLLRPLPEKKGKAYSRKKITGGEGESSREKKQEVAAAIIERRKMCTGAQDRKQLT